MVAVITVPSVGVVSLITATAAVELGIIISAAAWHKARRHGPSSSSIPHTTTSYSSPTTTVAVGRKFSAAVIIVVLVGIVVIEKSHYYCFFLVLNLYCCMAVPSVFLMSAFLEVCGRRCLSLVLLLLEVERSLFLMLLFCFWLFSLSAGTWSESDRGETSYTMLVATDWPWTRAKSISLIVFWVCCGKNGKISIIPSLSLSLYRMD